MRWPLRTGRRHRTGSTAALSCPCQKIAPQGIPGWPGRCRPACRNLVQSGTAWYGSSGAGSGTPDVRDVRSSGRLEHFEFETFCTLNHTDGRFVQNTRFSRSVFAGRRCAAASRASFSMATRSRQALSACAVARQRFTQGSRTTGALPERPGRAAGRTPLDGLPGCLCCDG